MNIHAAYEDDEAEGNMVVVTGEKICFDHYKREDSFGCRKGDIKNGVWCTDAWTCARDRFESHQTLNDVIALGLDRVHKHAWERKV